MFRFTIRDLLWLMVVVGLSIGWLLDRGRLATQLFWAEDTATILKNWRDQLDDEKNEFRAILNRADPDWRTTRGPFLYVRPYEDAGSLIFDQDEPIADPVENK